MRRRRRDAIIRLVITLALVLGAGVYFLGIHPLYDQVHKGLDLQGGIELVYQAKGTPQQPLNSTSLQQELQVINYRVNKLGVSDPVVQLEAAKARILVELAGVKNPQQAQHLIGTTANLEFKDSKGNTIVTGADLKSAQAATLQGGQNVVNITFDSAGAKKFAAYTAANQGQYMGIYLDGTEIENPQIQPGCCPSGQSQISGNFPTVQSAQNLAIELNSGALPLTLNLLSKNEVSATLGASSVRASLKAATVAIVLVAAFMFLTYRVPGFWADIALLVYALFFLMVLVALNATLTLPGITGLILSIGMAVDSNVIIYERIKEELRAGRTLRNAVDQGFHHGLRAIVDSNATTVIAALVLYYLGSGLIRGFAVTVGIGVVISLLTAVVFTRYLLGWLVTSGAQPSNWFFAPRAEVAFATAGGPPVAAGPRAPATPGRFSMANLRRDWRQDISGPDAEAAPPPTGDAVSEEPPEAEAEEFTAEQESATPAARGAPSQAPRDRGGNRSGKRRKRRGGR